MHTYRLYAKTPNPAWPALSYPESIMGWLVVMILLKVNSLYVKKKHQIKKKEQEQQSSFVQLFLLLLLYVFFQNKNRKNIAENIFSSEMKSNVQKKHNKTAQSSLHFDACNNNVKNNNKRMSTAKTIGGRAAFPFQCEF